VAAATLMLGARVASAEAILSPQHQKLGQGVKLVVDGKYAEAEPVLRCAIEMDPSMAEAHYNLAVVLRQTGRNEEAITEYRAAQKLFDPSSVPNQAKSLYGIALATDDLGDPARAARAWQEYIAFDRKYAGGSAALPIAQARLADAQRMAHIRVAPPGTQKAGR
jgi:tetratricopeptide (TPR) repeat protein